MKTREEAILWLRALPDEQGLFKAASLKDQPGEAAENDFSGSERWALQILFPTLPVILDDIPASTTARLLVYPEWEYSGMLSALGAVQHTPGHLYSFVARKRSNG